LMKSHACKTDITGIEISYLQIVIYINRRKKHMGKIYTEEKTRVEINYDNRLAWCDILCEEISLRYRNEPTCCTPRLMDKARLRRGSLTMGKIRGYSSDAEELIDALEEEYPGLFGADGTEIYLEWGRLGNYITGEPGEEVKPGEPVDMKEKTILIEVRTSEYTIKICPDSRYRRSLKCIKVESCSSDSELQPAA